MSASIRNIMAVLIIMAAIAALGGLHFAEEPESHQVLPSGSNTVLPAVTEEDIQLTVVIPGSDTTRVPLGRHRIAAHTDPDSRAFIDGREVKVYPSGAFVGLVPLQPGKTTSEIRVENAQGLTRSHTLVFYRMERDEAAALSPEPGEEEWTPFDDGPKVIEITRRNAFLNSGSGTDRLGGARLGYLERGVRLTAIGQNEAHYRVRLSNQLEAFLPLHFADLLDERTPQPQSLTGSATVTGNEKFDLVTLTLGMRLPYIASMRTNPNTIEVDIYGADSNTNWITHHKSAEGIRSVRWEQPGTRHFRLIITIEHNAHWGVHIGYGVGTSLRIQVQRPPQIASTDRPLQDVGIILDAGHGGRNLGAIGSTGALEKDIVLSISQKLQKRLEDEGARVFMTRDRDTDVSMTRRREMIVAMDAHVLVSIHANSIGYATNPDAIRGTSSYFRHDAFRPLAATVHRRMLELPLHDFGLIGSFNFSLNAMTEMPNVLVETAFMSHPEDEMKLLDPDFQDQMAEKLADGLMDFFLRFGTFPKISAHL